MTVRTGLLLGVDIGTSSMTGVLVDPDGNVRAHARQVLTTYRAPFGHVEHDPEEWWQKLPRLIGELLIKGEASAGGISGMACTGMGPCVVPVKADGSAAGRAILYGVDTRAGVQIAQLEQRFGKAGVRARCDNDLTSQSAGPKMLWLREHAADQYRTARYLLTSHSSLIFRMTGEAVTDHLTASYAHPFYDAGQQAWSPEAAEGLIDVAKLPRLGWPGEQAGQLCARAAAHLGLRVDLPVAVGSSDAPAEAVANGVTEPGEMLVMYGSSGFMIAPTTQRVSVPGLYSAPWIAPGTWQVAAGTSTAGAFLQWGQDILFSTVSDPYERRRLLLDAAARSQIGASGVTVLPHISGERTPFDDPTARAAIADLGASHTTADIARAAVEGVAASMTLAIQEIRAAVPAVREASASGGGTLNALLLQTVSSMAGIRQRVGAATEGAALGSAFFAAMASGAATSFNEVKQWGGPSRHSEPDPLAHDQLQQVLERHRSTYRALKERHSLG